MEARVRSYSSLGQDFASTPQERISAWRRLDRAAMLLPYEAINCINDEDPMTLEPFEAGSHVSVYHTDSAQQGLTKPKCVDVQTMLQWLRSHPAGQDVVPFPLDVQISYYVEKESTIATLESGQVDLRPIKIDILRVQNSMEIIYELIPFIPPNYPDSLVPGNDTYPYDAITIRSSTYPYTLMGVQRHWLIKKLYELYVLEEDRTSLVRVPYLADAMIRLVMPGDRSEYTSMDMLANPRQTRFKLHRTNQTIHVD
jgi:hypothetical protein